MIFKMKSIEEFFKNRISFTPALYQFTPGATTCTSKNAFKLKDHNNVFKKILPFCYYIFSDLSRNGD